MNCKLIFTIRATITIAFILLPSKALSSIEGTPHNLSSTGTGNACSYCHTPHGALSGTPLWNHALSSAVYKIYQSSSLQANVGQPTGSSKLCLSCHDGTVALGKTIRGANSDRTYIPPGAANLGTDLSDDHPVSFIYSAALAAQDVQIRSPLLLPSQLKLDKYGELQCTTCHDPHNNQFGKFLVMPNQQSLMCISCHDLNGWSGSSHQSSLASILAADDLYLQNSNVATVMEIGCLACHQPHSAGGHERLLHFQKLEDNCLNCHNGSVAHTDLRRVLLKYSRHDVKRYHGVHDLKESITSAARHVECVDCHNPHAARTTGAEPPLAPGALSRVSGVTASGNLTEQIRYEYEVCFKCHADNPNRPLSTITRQITQTNTRLEFDPSNPSFHPVVAPGVNQNVPSLRPPMTTAKIIYCTNCHNTSSKSAVKGPHGSDYPPLLAYRYETADYTRESESSYELCYKCHSRNSILNDESFPKHREHINITSCSVCHDAHGISSAQGTATNNSHLINFDTTIVSADPLTGRLEFEDLGVFRGRCYLKCHNNRHSPKDY